MGSGVVGRLPTANSQQPGPPTAASPDRPPLPSATFLPYTTVAMAASFDPLAAARTLRESGAAEPLATATVEVVQGATSDLVTRDFFRAEIAEVRGELYRALWFVSAGIVGINLTALGVATGVIVALG